MISSRRNSQCRLGSLDWFAEMDWAHALARNNIAVPQALREHFFIAGSCERLHKSAWWPFPLRPEAVPLPGNETGTRGPALHTGRRGSKMAARGAFNDRIIDAWLVAA